MKKLIADSSWLIVEKTQLQRLLAIGYWLLARNPRRIS